MRFLQSFMATFEVVEDEDAAVFGTLSLVMRNGQPAVYFDADRIRQPFAIVQMNDFDTPSSEDIAVLWSTTNPEDDKDIALFIIDRGFHLQGLISAEELDDLRCSLKVLVDSSSKELGTGGQPLPGVVGRVRAIAWKCSCFPDAHPAFYPYQAGVPIPHCPICDCPRADKNVAHTKK